MIEEVEFETYLSIEKNKFQIYLFNKYSLKDVVELLFAVEKINKKKIYEICLNLKNNEENN